MTKEETLNPNLLRRLFLILTIWFCGVLFPDTSAAQTQIVDDKVLLDSMKNAVDLMYNMEFEKAENCLKRFRPKYNTHPGFLLYGALNSYWKHFPISHQPKEYQVFMKNLEQIISLGEKMKQKNPKSPEADFYQLMGNLLMARHHAEEGEYIRAVNETRKAYGFIKKGFELQKNYPDFYLTTGLFNYYREVYPENHPTYKPFTIFFQSGNKSLGIKELELCAQKSLFCKGEALMFLSLIYLRDEYNLPMALRFSTQLHQNFPGNWVYDILQAEILLENKKADLAEPLISKTLMRTEPVALLAGYYLKGLYEIGENKPDAAKWAFQKALQQVKGKDKLTLSYRGLCFSELGKIANAEGKKDWMKKYFKQALEICSFKKVKQDAENAGY